jgi:hypothetical protein
VAVRSHQREAALVERCERRVADGFDRRRTPRSEYARAIVDTSGALSPKRTSLKPRPYRSMIERRSASQACGAAPAEVGRERKSDRAAARSAPVFRSCGNCLGALCSLLAAR